MHSDAARQGKKDEGRNTPTFTPTKGGGGQIGGKCYYQRNTNQVEE